MGIFDGIVKGVTNIVGKVVKDKDLAQQLTSELNGRILGLVEKEMEAQKAIILAEASGGWLQRNWRPLMMVWFAVLIGANWFGFTPDNLSPEQTADLYQLVKIGIGGYVIGRSAEKIAPAFMKK